MRKKTALLLLCAWMVFLMNPSFAMQISDQTISTLPGTWTVSAAPAGSSGAEMQEGRLRLYFDTTAVASKGKSEVTTSYYSFENRELVLSMKTRVSNNGADVVKSLSVLDTKVFNLVELFRFSEDNFSAFGGAATKKIDTSVEQEILLAVNPVSGIGTVWLNQERLFSGAVANWKSGMDLANLRYLFKNSASASVSTASTWDIDSFSCHNNGAYSFYSRPENNQAMVTVDSLSAVTLKYGCVLSPALYSAGSYRLQKDSAEIPFTLSYENGSILIVPEGGFEALKSYSLLIPAVIDLYGNEVDAPKTVTFTTAPVGYQLPAVAFKGNPSQIQLTEGEVHSFVAEVTNGSAASVEILVDGLLAETLTKSPYEYDFSAPQGSYTVQAVAVDSLGGRGYGAEVPVTVQENDKPILTLTGLSEGAVLESVSLPTVHAAASDTNGIARIVMDADRIFVSETAGAEGNFSLEGVGAGIHVIRFTAYDRLGLANSVEFNIEIKKSIFSIAYQNDFSDYAGSNAVPSGMQGGAQRGYLESSVVSEAFGKSLLIGMDTVNPAYTVGNPAYVGIPVSNSTGRVFISFDLYIQDKTDGFLLTLKKGGGTEQYVANFTPTNFLYYNKSGAQAATMPYETKKWYHFEVFADMVAKTFTMSMDGTPVITNGEIASSLDSLTHFRIFGPNYDTVKTYAALDNVVVKNYSKVPSIASIGTGGIVDYRSQSFTVTLTDPIFKDSFSADKVSVTNEFGAVKLSSVSLDGTVLTVKPAQPLESNTLHRITLSETTELASGVPSGVPVSAVFTTSQAGIEVLSGTYTKTVNGTYFNAEILNSTGAEKQALIISQIWEGNQVKSVKAQAVTVPASQTAARFSVKMDRIASGERIQTYLWDGLNRPVSLAKHVFLFE